MIERLSGLAESPPRAPTASGWCSPRSGCSPGGCSPTCAAYPKLVGRADRGRHRPGGGVLRGGAGPSTTGPTCPGPTGCGTWASAEAAEMAKLAETTYRDVNIGLANQFARFADTVGIDVQRVIEACNSQPYSHIHQPGIAVGGHCIPVYPRLYLSTDPERQRASARPGPRTPRCRSMRWPGPRPCSGRWPGCGSPCSARPTAARSRRPRSPGSSAPCEALTRAGGRGAGARPDVRRHELAALRLGALPPR